MTVIAHTASDRCYRSFQLRPDVAVTQNGSDVELSHPWGRQRIGGLGKAASDRLVAMQSEPIPQEGSPGGARLRAFLERLAYLVTTTVSDGSGQALITVVPIARSALPVPIRPLEVDERPAVSRFAYLRRLIDAGSDMFVLESPMSPYRIRIEQPAISTFITALTGQRTVAEAASSAGIPVDVAAVVAGILVHTGLLDIVPAESDDAMALWDFHDLLFHSRSRAGRHDYPMGGLFRHVGRAQLPAVPAPVGEGPGIDLVVPTWGTVLARDPRFTEVLEGRRSVRSYGQTPVTVEQLGELLYRAARVRSVVAGAPDSPTAYDVVNRPYPAGGATGELEIYLSVVGCEGLEPGIYRYDAAAHQLHRRQVPEDAFRELVTGAWRATNGTVTPQVVITVVSRVARLSWKYSHIAYALTLKHVGVLYQTLYLVATAMGLAPCGLGSGDSDVAARALGVDWTTDCAVGEFLIGSLAPDTVAAPTGFADVISQYRPLD
jgi:SagB-type dehydrogenase family enzyme